MKPILFASVVLFSISGCGQNEAKESVKEMAIMLAPPSKPIGLKSDIAFNEPESKPEQTISDTSKKIIKTGSIGFETNDLKSTRKRIIIALKKLSGYVAEENETNNDGYNSELTLKLRVPARNFDLLLDSVSVDAGKIDSKNISVRDVTTQYIDIKTQITNKKILENTYLGLLQKAGKIGDVLQIENKITSIRTTIDSTQGELNYLNKQAAYSSLTVNFHTKQMQQDSNNNGFGHKLMSAITSGWLTLQGVFFSLITSWPVVLLIIILYIFIRRWRRGRKLKGQTL